MRMFYYKSPHGNVGDDLNAVLWPRVFGSQFFDDQSDRIFLGIGSIFDDGPEIIETSNSVVFGSGLRNKRRVPKDLGRFDIKFVRGPLSKSVLKTSDVKYISDPAILSPLYIKPEPVSKKYTLGYVPYFKAPEELSCAVASAIGARIISPTLSPQEFINEISSCEKILSEAMHGAILADSYRIPWAGCRLMSGLIEGRTSLFKWKDWMESLDIKAKIWCPFPESFLYAPRKARQFLDKYVMETAASSIIRFVKQDRWELSVQKNIQVAQEKIQDEVDAMLRYSTR